MTQGRATSGIVINVFLAVLIGSFSMAMLTPEMQAITKARAAAAKLYATIDRVPAIDSSNPSGLRPDTVKGTITFENVKFHYPSRPNVPILKGLTTTFDAGHTVALVGASGSGKSTVVALIERFYDPILGSIKLDGQDIKSLNIKWLRQQIGILTSFLPATLLMSFRSRFARTHTLRHYSPWQCRAWSHRLSMGECLGR